MQQRGSDINIAMNLTFDEAIFGCEKSFHTAELKCAQSVTELVQKAEQNFLLVQIVKGLEEFVFNKGRHLECLLVKVPAQLAVEQEK